MKLSENQLKWAQIILGIVGGALMWYTIWLPISIPNGSNTIFGFLFLGVFLAIFLLQKYIEKRMGRRLALFTKTYIISLIVGLALFVIYALSNGITFFK